MRAEIIRNTDLLNVAPVEVVGGKGFGLLKLTELSRGRGFEVPEFYIIPVNFQYSEASLENLYGLISGPLAVRSSSPYEDSRGFSFAGKFKSVLNVNDFDSFKKAVNKVLESANSYEVRKYSLEHGISIDNKMAVIVQKMIDPYYSGVCYSTSNPNNPRTIVESIKGLSNRLMSGVEQGSITNFDKNFNLTMEHGWQFPGLERVARVARNLEAIYKEKLDIEYAVSHEDRVYIVQARPVTDPMWEQIQLPKLEDTQLVAEADIVRGSGKFIGPAFIFRSPTEIKEYGSMHNKIPDIESEKQLDALDKFDRTNEGGYCLITDTVEYHEQILRQNLVNLKVLITVDYASRFSHPIKIVSEMGVFYLGILGKKDLLDFIETGDTISVASDQTRGVMYDLIKTPVELSKVNLEGVQSVRYEDTIANDFPSYEEVDDKLFLDSEGQVGVIFWDYNEESGVPTDVYYNLIRIQDGLKIGTGEYHSNEAIFPQPNFPYLLHDLLFEARLQSARLSNKDRH